LVTGTAADGILTPLVSTPQAERMRVGGLRDCKVIVALRLSFASQ
jgi:hypothetical protein